VASPNTVAKTTVGSAPPGSERAEPAAALLSGPTTVAAEAELLRKAETYLRVGDAVHALALVNEHATSFPNGILVEEREAERVVVLCTMGRTAQAREVASVFLRDHARSPLAVRVRSSCAGP
jgi:RNA polymerase sigma-70 factor (ECF subfamily)